MHDTEGDMTLCWDVLFGESEVNSKWGFLLFLSLFGRPSWFLKEYLADFVSFTFVYSLLSAQLIYTIVSHVLSPHVPHDSTPVFSKLLAMSQNKIVGIAA